MVIRIVGKDLRFDGGVAMLCEWGSLWQHEAVQRTGYCSHNLIRDVELAAPGRYFLWLEGSTAEYVPSGRRTAFNVTAPWTLDITESDLQRGEAVLSLPSAQLFTVTVTRAGIPAGGQALHFLGVSGSAEMTSEMRADEKGVLVILGDPAEAIPLEGDDLTVLVEPFQ